MGLVFGDIGTSPNGIEDIKTSDIFWKLFSSIKRQTPASCSSTSCPPPSCRGW